MSINIDKIMCTKQKLYEKMTQGNLEVMNRSSRPLSSAQIELATDCLRVLANRHDISIGEMSHVIRGKKLYPRFYSLLRRSPRLSKMQLVNEMQKSL